MLPHETAYLSSNLKFSGEEYLGGSVNSWFQLGQDLSSQDGAPWQPRACLGFLLPLSLPLPACCKQTNIKKSSIGKTILPVPRIKEMDILTSVAEGLGTE